jgi:FkbM family methyltransferase
MDNVLSNQELVEKFINLQKIIKPDVSIEIGAHEAKFSKAMSNIIEDVWAFEANPHVYDFFYPIKNVKYLNKAVSNIDGKIKFFMQQHESNTVGNNSIIKRNENIDYNVIDIESISLNNNFKKYKNICLWIDCEGASKEVLIGASEILKNVSTIFIEVENYQFWENQWLFKDLSEYLNLHDFILFAKDLEYGLNQHNCIFIKKELEGVLNNG